MKKYWSLFAFLAVAALVPAAALAQEEAKPAKPARPAKVEKYKVGDTLKDAKLTDMSGKEASLLALTKGKATVVNFFAKH